MQVLFYLCITHDPTTGSQEDLVATIVSESIPNSKKGPYLIAQSIMNDLWVQSNIVDWNRTDRVITFRSGFRMEFTSYVDEQQAKQGKRRYSFFNEAQSIAWPVFWQLAKRTRVRTFIDYNPTAPFWAHDKLIGTGPEQNDLSAVVQLIISDHRHNPFLSDDDHRKTENIKDPELWKVYARGMTGNVTGLIYPDWTRIPDDQFPWDEPPFGGLDFGYTNDPTAGVRIARIGESIFIHELCYTPGLTPIQTKQLFFASSFTSSTPVYCEHDPDIVSQLRRLDVLALPARKGPGSISAGITKIKEYKVFYTASSKNLEIERQRYIWIKNPDTGVNTNTPIDAYNHLLDACRYGIYTHFYRE